MCALRLPLFSLAVVAHSPSHRMAHMFSSLHTAAQSFLWQWQTLHSKAGFFGVGGEERGHKDQRGEQEFATHQFLVASTFRECFSEGSLLSEKLLSKRIG